MKPRIFLALLVCYAQALFAQIIEPLGQVPPKIKWNEINTLHFRILFPDGMLVQAERTANALENAYFDVAHSLAVLPPKTPIILQNQTTDNNAFVSSEPRRAEFFSTPPQNPNSMGMNDWFDELSLHEYRHVVQQEQSKQGWGKYIYYLFGNSGTSIMQGMTNPWWFWEGDAVGCESTMGYGGRGRIPSFDLTFRTQLLSRGAFPYVKAACGSLRNAIPNHYVLGYFMTTYVKNHHGADAWDRIMTQTYTKPPLPFSFSRSMKKITGMNTEETYAAMTNELKQLWGKQRDNVKETPVSIFGAQHSRVFVNYKFPQYLPDGTIVAQKAALEAGSFLAYKSNIVDQSQFVVLSPDGKEKKLRISGVLDDNGMMSSAGSKIVWSEFTYDPRWGARNYTVIKTLDLVTNRQKQLTHRSRYHAPCLSPDGKMIATMEYTTECKFFLVLLEAENGKLVKRFENPGNKQYLQAHFTSDGKGILLVRAEPGAKTIVRLDIETGTMRNYSPPVNENLSAPIDFDHYVLFNSPQSGIDNIYAIDTTDGQAYQVTNRQYGAFNPCVSPDHHSISFQDFTPDGFRVVTMPLEPGGWKKIHLNTSDTGKIYYFRPFENQEAGNILDHIPDSTYSYQRYHHLKHSLNVYSWGFEPLANVPELLSIGIKSQDLLSTAVLEAGFRYNSNENHWGKYAKLSYEGLYPKFFIAYGDGKRKTIFSDGEVDTTITSPLRYDLIGYYNISAGFSIPLNLSSGPYIRKLSFTAQTVYNDFHELNRGSSHKYEKTRFGDFFSQQYDALLEIRQRQSLRDVAPRLGTLLEFRFRNAPFNSFFSASQSALDVNLYLPGFFPHHALRFRSYWQQDDSSNYHFENAFTFFRGQSNELFHHLQLWSVDYKLSIAYPDFSFLNGLLYFQRLKADLFTEWGKGRSAYMNYQGGPLHQFNTIGMELTADVNFMRFLIPFDAGFRGTYAFQIREMSYDFLLKVPIF